MHLVLEQALERYSTDSGVPEGPGLREFGPWGCNQGWGVGREGSLPPSPTLDGAQPALEGSLPEGSWIGSPN